jgi:mycothiol synthase
MRTRIRHFNPDDVHTFVDIYNQARPIEVAHLNEERFWSWFSDASLDAERDVLIAEDDDGPVGGVVTFPWPGHLAEGYVFFVGPSVLPDFQHHGVGRQLMQTLFAELAERYPGKTLQTRLHPSNTKAHEFLTQMGFTVDRRFWQMTHPAPGKVQAGPAPEGIEVDYLQPGDDPTEAIALYRRILDDSLVSHQALDADQLKSWAGLQNFTANSFLLARHAGRVIGLCFQTFSRGEASQVQFLGVLPEYRGRGIATYLLRRALADAHANGKARVRLEVTGDDIVAQQLYKRLGFEVTDGEVFYQRPLSEQVPSA